MIEMLEILQELAEKAAKDLPEDVLADLKELSRLQADVHMCLIQNKIIDTGKIKRINEMVRKHFYHGKPEEKAAINTFDFGEAIRRVKDGARVARKGWNGKEQYIEIAMNIKYSSPKKNAIHAIHEDIGSTAVAFIGTRGVQVGWLASQADMLADDWYELIFRHADRQDAYDAARFAALEKAYKDKAWKSHRHEDGELCFGGGWFIVGIDTPEGSFTYHYEDKDWDRFDCQELPVAKHWDGHREENVTRLMSLPDVRPVVLCRDCKWTKTDEMEDPAIYCEKWDRWEMPPDAFCYLGKHREAPDA